MADKPVPDMLKIQACSSWPSSSSSSFPKPFCAPRYNITCVSIWIKPFLKREKAISEHMRTCRALAPLVQKAGKTCALRRCNAHTQSRAGKAFADRRWNDSSCRRYNLSYFSCLPEREKNKVNNIAAIYIASVGDISSKHDLFDASWWRFSGLQRDFRGFSNWDSCSLSL